MAVSPWTVAVALAVLQLCGASLLDNLYVPENLLPRLRRDGMSELLLPSDVELQSDRNHETSFRHAYHFGYGSASRDELLVKIVRREPTFDGAKFDITQWVTDHETRRVALGLTPNSLVVCQLSGEIINATCNETGTLGKPMLAALYSIRRSSGLEVYVISALKSDEKISLQWFLVHGTSLETLGSPWILHRTPHQLLLFRVLEHFKLVILNAPVQDQQTADVYDFALDSNGVQLWLTQRISLSEAVRAAVNYVNDFVYLSVSQGRQEVQVFEYKDNRFEILTRVPSKGVMDIRAFRIGFMSFLALSGEEPRVIRIPPSRDQTDILQFNSSVRQWLAVRVPTYRDEAILLAETDDGIHVVTWSYPSQFTVAANTECIVADGSDVQNLTCLVSLNGAAGIVINREAAILLPARTQETRNNLQVVSPEIFMAIARLEHLPNPFQLKFGEMIYKRNNIEAQLQAQTAAVKEAKRKLEHIFKPDSVVTAPWTIQHVTSSNLEVSGHFNVQELQVGGIPWTHENWHHLNSLELETSGQLERFRNRVNELHGDLDEAVVFFDEEGNLNIPSSQQFDGTIQVQGKTVIQSAEITYLNDFPVSELLENIVQLGRHKTIGGHKQFSSVEVEDLYIRDKLNDGPVQPFASSAKPIEIHGNLIFTQPLMITGDLKSNGMNTSSLRTASNEMEHEAHNVTSLSLDRIEVQGFINGKPVSHFIERLAEEPQSAILNVTGTLKIIGDLDAEYINGININQFIEQLVPLQSTDPIHIPGETFIQNCSVNNMEVTLLNELSFPEEYVLQGGSANISGYKNFDSALVTEHLDVTNFLNNVPVDQLVTLDNAGHLAGDWTFENITIKDFLLVENDLDAGIIEMLQKTAISQAVNVVIKNLKVLEDIYISEPGFLQGFVYKGGESQKIEAPKYFQGRVKVHELYLQGSLNNISVDDFITMDTKQIIPGNLSFMDEVTMIDVDVDGTVLSVDLKNLSKDAILLSMPQMCEMANIKFAEPLVAGNLRIDTLNGLKNEHFITLDSNQTLTEPLIFQTLEAEKLAVTGNVDTEHLVNDEDLRHVDEYRVSRRRDQKIMGNWKIGHAKVRKTLDIDHINDILIGEFESHFMLPDFTIGESLKFDDIVVVGDVKTQFLNDLDMDEMAKNAIWVNKENTITGNLNIQGSLITEDLNVEGTLNNEIVKDIAEDIVMEDEAVVTFMENKTFVNGAHIKNIDCEYLNGRKLSDILTKSSPQFINGPITFTGPVEFTEDVSFLYLNGLPKSSWQGVYSFENGEHVINGGVNFTNSFKVENLHVSGMTHGLNVDKFFQGVVWRNDNIVIRGNKTFTSPVVVKDALKIAETYNGVDLNKFLENVIYIDYPGEIKGPVTFHQDVHADKGITVKNLKVDNIQNCSLSDWTTHAVYLDQSMPMMGSKIFETISSSGSVKIDTLNKVDMDEVFLLHKDQYIPEVLTFASVSTTGNVPVGGLVNEWRIDDELTNTLMMYGDQEVMSSKNFLDDANVRRDIFLSGTVNGYDLKDIVTLDTDQTIHGVRSFHEILVLSDIQVQGPVNGQDLESWSGKVVRTNSPLGEITGRWDVRGNVTVLGSVLGTGSVLDGVPLTEFITTQTSRQNFADKLSDDIEREKNKLCKTVEDLLETARKQTYTFQYLEGVQYFPTLHPILSSIHIKSHFDLLVVSYAGVCEGLLLQWDILRESFTPVLSLAFGGVNSWVVLPASKNGDIFLVSAGQSNCPHSGGNLWVAKRGKPVMFQHVETLGNWTRVEQSPLDPYTIFSLDVNGNLTEWKYSDSIGLEFIRSFGAASADIVNDPIKVHSLIATKSKSPWKLNENESIGNKSHLVITTHKHNARVKGNHDDIKIFEGQPRDRQLFHRLHVTDPGSVLSIQFPHERYIAFMEDSSWLQLYRYEGVAGFHKVASVHLLGAQLLQVLRLPAQDLLSLRPMLLLSLPAPNPGLYLLEMRMLGDPAPHLPLAEDCFSE